jgi:hypothetical protein
MKEGFNFDEATKTTLGAYFESEPKGMFYTEEVSNGRDDEHYFSDIDELAERIAYEKGEENELTLEHVPKYVWPCVGEELTLSAQDILENALETQEFFEGAYDHIDDDDIELMQRFLNFWCKKVALKTWYAMGKEVIVLSDDERNAILRRAQKANAC